MTGHTKWRGDADSGGGMRREGTIYDDREGDDGQQAHPSHPHLAFRVADCRLRSNRWGLRVAVGGAIGQGGGLEPSLFSTILALRPRV